MDIRKHETRLGDRVKAKLYWWFIRLTGGKY